MNQKDLNEFLTGNSAEPQEGYGVEGPKTVEVSDSFDSEQWVQLENFNYSHYRLKGVRGFFSVTMNRVSYGDRGNHFDGIVAKLQPNDKVAEPSRLFNHRIEAEVYGDHTYLKRSSLEVFLNFAKANGANLVQAEDPLEGKVYVLPKQRDGKIEAMQIAKGKPVQPEPDVESQKGISTQVVRQRQIPQKVPVIRGQPLRPARIIREVNEVRSSQPHRLAVEVKVKSIESPFNKVAAVGASLIKRLRDVWNGFISWGMRAGNDQKSSVPRNVNRFDEETTKRDMLSGQSLFNPEERKEWTFKELGGETIPEVFGEERTSPAKDDWFEAASDRRTVPERPAVEDPAEKKPRFDYDKFTF